MQPHLTTIVSDFIRNKSWQIPSSVLQSFPSLAARIHKIIIPIDSGPDRLCWKHSADGNLTFKGAFTFLNPCPNQVRWGRPIWNGSIPPSKLFLTWRLILNKLPADENLISRGCVVVSIYCHCKRQMETTDHLFFHCEYASFLWNWLSNLLHASIDHSNVLSLLSILDRNWSSQLKDVILSAITHIIWVIWLSRNLIRFENKYTSAARAIHLVTANVSLSGNLSKVRAFSTHLRKKSFTSFLLIFILLNLQSSFKLIG